MGQERWGKCKWKAETTEQERWGKFIWKAEITGQERWENFIWKAEATGQERGENAYLKVEAAGQLVRMLSYVYQKLCIYHNCPHVTITLTHQLAILNRKL